MAWPGVVAWHEMARTFLELTMLFHRLLLDLVYSYTTCSLYDTSNRTREAEPFHLFVVRIRVCMSHSLWPIFHGRYVCGWNRGGRLRGRLCKHLAERYFRRRIVRYRHPLGSQAIGLGNPPPGGVIYAVVPGIRVLTCSGKYS